MCKGDMNHRKPKTAKIILGLNLGLYHQQWPVSPAGLPCMVPQSRNTNSVAPQSGKSVPHCSVGVLL